MPPNRSVSTSGLPLETAKNVAKAIGENLAAQPTALPKGIGREEIASGALSVKQLIGLTINQMGGTPFGLHRVSGWKASSGTLDPDFRQNQRFMERLEKSPTLTADDLEAGETIWQVRGGNIETVGQSKSEAKKNFRLQLFDSLSNNVSREQLRSDQSVTDVATEQPDTQTASAGSQSSSDTSLPLGTLAVVAVVTVALFAFTE